MEKLTTQDLIDILSYSKDIKNDNDCLNFELTGIKVNDELRQLLMLYINEFKFNGLMVGVDNMLNNAMMTGFQLGRLFSERKKDLKEMERMFQ